MDLGLIFRNISLALAGVIMLLCVATMACMLVAPSQGGPFASALILSTMVFLIIAIVGHYMFNMSSIAYLPPVVVIED